MTEIKQSPIDGVYLVAQPETMKKTGTLLCLFLLLTGTAISQDAREIVRRSDEKARGSTSIASVTIQIVRPKWTREMTVRSWSKGNSLSMILVTAPVKDKGIVFLKRDREVWNWIPSIERNIKLPPSMMSQSWMGTDFTNDDLVKEASIVSDYSHRLSGDTILAGRSCYQLCLIPLPHASVVWGEVILWIDRTDYLLMRAEYYDEEHHLVNTLITGDIRLLGGRLLPGRMEMIPADKPGQRTILQYQSLTFDIPIDDRFFTTQNMPRLQ
ncbi:MAG: hypothetical protein RJA57_1510 [Bacteroidota bacterium]